MQQSPLWDSNSSSAKQKVLAHYVTRRFITASTISRHLYLSSGRSIHSTPSQPTSFRFILILFSYLYLSLQNGIFFLKVSLPKPCKHLSSLPYVPHIPAHLILLHFISRIIFVYYTKYHTGDQMTGTAWWNLTYQSSRCVHVCVCVCVCVCVW